MLDFMLGVFAAVFMVGVGICIKDTVEDQKEKLARKVKYEADVAVSEKLKAICIWQIPGLGDYIKETVDEYLADKEDNHDT